MKFFEQQNQLLWEDFQRRFCAEAEILKEAIGQDVSLVIDGDILKLSSPHSNPIYIDLLQKLDYHQKFFYKNSLYHEPLAKALGIKKGQPKPIVLDATAGMLGDTSLMLAMGCQVIACERNPLIAALILNGLRRAQSSVRLHFGDALTCQSEVDVIYFDPMYVHKNDKTLPKKEMQLFRELLGADEDAKQVASNLKTRCKRLVLKRSSKVGPLLANPSMSFIGKSTSYDVYLNLA
jgi:16S rRNA (guanine1516-N2)-methyltransferase